MSLQSFSFLKKIKELFVKPTIVLDESKKSSGIISNLSALEAINVSDIMITRQDIFALDVNTTKQEIIDVIKEKHYTRIPIYKKNLDNIVGFIHIKDIICHLDNDFHIRDIMRNIIFVPTPMKALDLLVRMQNLHIHAAIVLDEYGGTEGLVTITDIIEEVIGEIDDEHDKNTDPTLTKIADGKFEVEGRMEIVTIAHVFNINFKDNEDYDTIGGLINFLLGRIPEKGETITDENKITYIVTEVDDRCIHKVIMDLNNFSQCEGQDS